MRSENSNIPNVIEAKKNSKNLVEKDFTDFGISNYQDILDSLVISGEKRIKKYFQILNQIKDKIGVEGIELLHREFGIIHFDRYGAQKMIRQYEYFKDRENLKGDGNFSVGFFPYSDSDDAFLRPDIFRRYDSFQSKQNKKVLYYESGSPFGFSKKFFRAVEKFGRFSSVVVGAHSGGNALTLNRFPKYDPKNYSEGEFKEVEIDNIQVLKDDTISSFLTDDAYIILFACDTGSLNSFGPSLSKVIDRVVIVPVGDSDDLDIKGIFTSNISDRKLTFPEVSFGEDERGRPTRARYFLNGRLLPLNT